ncbi:MAG: hypothetical protein ACTHKT_13675 [Solirubrobacterales bacterium]
MSNPPRNMRPIVLYVPAGSRSTARIPRGSALVAQPRCGVQEIEVYFEGAPPGRRGLRTLADRALSASGRLLERAVFGGCLLVPPAALTVVGTVNFPAGTIALTGPHSARAVANWLGAPYLDPAELRESGRAVVEHEELAAAAWTSALEPELLHALLKRGGVERDGGDWCAADGRRTTAVGDALLWALERIAQGADGGRRGRRK